MKKAVAVKKACAVVEEIQQSPRDAVYAMFLGDPTGRFFPEKLTIVSSAEFDHSDIGFIVQVAIIGESHFLHLKRSQDDQIIFTELLACVNPLDYGFKPDDSKGLKKGPFRLHALSREQRYSVTVTVDVRSKTNDRRQFIPKMKGGKRTPGQRLKVSFPGDLKPRTIVSYTLNRCKMVITTVHEYVTEDGRFVEPLTSTTAIIFR